ncbi:hypothetical protein DSUL_50348 [Desulfovibrionales bacterium]
MFITNIPFIDFNDWLCHARIFPALSAVISVMVVEEVSAVTPKALCRPWSI